MKRSAGLLLYRKGPHGPAFFLVHPGGPVLGKEGRGGVVDSEGIVRTG